MSNTLPRVAVVIPFYKTQLTPSEKLSLRLAQKYLSDFDIYLLSPQKLKTTLKYPQVKFADHYFSSVSTYSELLLTEAFYKAFIKYDYILIYQLDALVLSNQLMEWCRQGFDYIGAPWDRSMIGFLTLPSGKLRAVGNGGFSLRKVKTHLNVLQKVRAQARISKPSKTQALLGFFLSLIIGKTRQQWLPYAAQYYPFNEDGFWSFEAQKYDPDFRIPVFTQALSFAIETNPVAALNRLGGKFPFGVHAWEKFDRTKWLNILINQSEITNENF